MRTAGPIGVIVAALLGGCGDGGAPANVAGTYTIALRNDSNGCALVNWQEGMTSQGTRLQVNQNPMDPSQATATVQGLEGAGLNLWLGSSAFLGTVRGSSLDLTIMGTRGANSGNCAFTTNARATATVSGDVIMGTVRYFYATNGAPDCGTRSSCATLQTFNGTRPPSM